MDWLLLGSILGLASLGAFLCGLIFGGIISGVVIYHGFKKAVEKGALDGD